MKGRHSLEVNSLPERRMTDEGGSSNWNVAPGSGCRSLRRPHPLAPSQQIYSFRLFDRRVASPGFEWRYHAGIALSALREDNKQTDKQRVSIQYVRATGRPNFATVDTFYNRQVSFNLRTHSCSVNYRSFIKAFSDYTLFIILQTEEPEQEVHNTSIIVY